MQKLLIALTLCMSTVFGVTGLMNYYGAWVSGTIYHITPVLHTNVSALPLVTSNGNTCVMITESGFESTTLPESAPLVWNCSL